MKKLLFVCLAVALTASAEATTFCFASAYNMCIANCSAWRTNCRSLLGDGDYSCDRDYRDCAGDCAAANCFGGDFPVYLQIDDFVVLEDQ